MLFTSSALLIFGKITGSDLQGSSTAYICALDPSVSQTKLLHRFIVFPGLGLSIICFLELVHRVRVYIYSIVFYRNREHVGHQTNMFEHLGI